MILSIKECHFLYTIQSKVVIFHRIFSIDYGSLHILTRTRSVVIYDQMSQPCAVIVSDIVSEVNCAGLPLARVGCAVLPVVFLLDI